MFKKVQKKSTKRVRDNEDEAEESLQLIQQQHNHSSAQVFSQGQDLIADHHEDDINKENRAVKPTQNHSISNEADDEFENSSKSSMSLTVKKRADSRFTKRRGLVHQGSIQSSSMSYTQSHSSDQIIDDQAMPPQPPQTKKSLFQRALEPQIDSEMNDGDVSSNTINDQIMESQNQDYQAEQELEDDDYFAKSHNDEIQRVKELRNQRRKLEGNDYFPFDESTSGGIYAKDQIHAVNNRKDTLEAHLLQRQLIKEQYQMSHQPPQSIQLDKLGFDKNRQKLNKQGGIYDLDNGIYQDQLMSGNESEEDQEEIEAFIKKRVKEGTGKDYEQIIKRDVTAYAKLGQESDFNDINKFENSKQYKDVQIMMELEIGDYLQEIDEEIINLTDSIQANQDRLNELSADKQQAENEIQELDAKFEKVGEEFIQAKEAVDNLEELNGGPQ